MAMGGAEATFDVDTFTWCDGAFELSGRWHGGDGLGRVRLLVEVEGRERNIGSARGQQAADGDGWQARFLCSKAPAEGAAATLLAGDLEVELPAPELTDAPLIPPPPTAAPVGGDDDALLRALRSEREAVQRAREALAKERRAAEEVEQRLRTLQEQPVPAPRRPVPLSQRPEKEMQERLDVTPFFWIFGAVAVLFFLVLLGVL